MFSGTPAISTTFVIIFYDYYFGFQYHNCCEMNAVYERRMKHNMNMEWRTLIPRTFIYFEKKLKYTHSKWNWVTFIDSPSPSSTSVSFLRIHNVRFVFLNWYFIVNLSKILIKITRVKQTHITVKQFNHKYVIQTTYKNDDDVSHISCWHLI